MSGEQLTDWNFDGWSNEKLADEVHKLQTGSGELARQFAKASDVLRDLAGSLQEVDQELRTQLKALGIDWGGAAGEQGQQQTKVTSEGFEDAGQATVGNSDAMARQGESTTSARHSSPDAETLRKDSEKTLLDKGAGLIGIETDHAAEVEATNRARQQAIDSLNGYTKNSQSAIDSFRTPNPPPDIVVASGAVSTPVGPPVGVPHATPPGIPGGPGFPGTPGTPGSPGVPVGPTPNIPGNSTGILPGPGTPNPIAAGTGLPKPFPSTLPVGIAAAGAAATGLAGASTTARGAQVVGGGRGPSQAPKTPIAPAGPKGAPSTIGAGKGGPGAPGAPGGPGATGKGPGGTMTPGGATGVGPEGNRPGAAAAKGGAPGKGAGSLMSPAAGAAKGEGEEDGEHVRKYGVDSDDVFGDERMVVQSVIGEDPKDQ
ncbi:hypothetical protein [Lentzea flava]|uniref:PPE family protein n=1 Tax=Lentzea flava TaxID=103732 RepID=A0ABQ2UBK1_9PSEU|nr:hypothetical protein [Lentzea flava]MCP2197320.1 hypothetical protein [Lentzea flava]GGU18829.1 hypothetical protein GCM10010178_08420 [Lentzea flava]